jgi:hypothetical protein
LLKIDVDEPAVWEWVFGMNMLVAIKELLSQVNELGLCEGPKLGLRRIPVVGSHVDVLSSSIAC